MKIYIPIYEKIKDRKKQQQNIQVFGQPLAEPKCCF
jgi:hypothetical protein